MELWIDMFARIVALTDGNRKLNKLTGKSARISNSITNIVIKFERFELVDR